MRYTIGVTIKEKFSSDSYTGFCATNRSGRTFCLCNWGENEEKATKDYYGEYYRIPVFNDIKTAQIYAECLCRQYRRDDVWLLPKEKSKKIRHFYPVKVDSLNFPYSISLSIKHCNLEFKKNRFNERTDLQGTYSFYYINGLK